MTAMPELRATGKDDNIARFQPGCAEWASRCEHCSLEGQSAETKKTRKNGVKRESLRPGAIVPPQGVEEIANSHGKTTISQLGGVAGGVISPELMELIALWPNIPSETRTAFLAIARNALK
jgi:hypothetical protein